MAVQSCGPLACNLYALTCLDCRSFLLILPPNTIFFKNSVKHILLTRGHPDHVIGVAECARQCSGASLGLHPWEDENYRHARQVGHAFGLDMPDVLSSPTHSLLDGDVISAGSLIRLRVVHTPGPCSVRGRTSQQQPPMALSSLEEICCFELRWVGRIS